MSCTNPNCECKAGSYANLNPPTRANIDAQVEALQRIIRKPSRGKLVYEFVNSAYNVKLFKRNANTYTVVYGKQVKTALTYADAAHELGQCIMHALSIEGKLD